ncbi:glycine--tRNA ligase subunit beta [Alkalilimnicola ehrlichii MLHE-1]|uniref:Glycine--tRNA ligase beta subunit n=1 Tax=Alkalilimnicola ehrlichii (strain ATCC BAA-1101 / DSM 17681 / MLHE-1) TaxID=187272 RepID=Q0ACR7_ALKEH|nr:glycine--tRNA ligase subunit beta [Alkalilimnicola ehrlichii]ABI55370.1 glycyl-tRNA synthetase beta chain [Alkalilimnicola ehrlichii MLHE-1]
MAESTRTLLIEIGTEELPPVALPRLEAAFRDGVVQGLEQAELGHGPVHSYATPRRLALQVEALQARQEDKAIERRGPALNVAFDDHGRPTKAAEGFARSCGATVEQLERLETPKGTWLAWRGVQPGRAATELLPDIVNQSLSRLPIPKRMRWGSGQATFVRPVHWIVFLLGADVVPATLMDVTSGRTTRGHRFHAPEPIELASADDYAERLRGEGRVEASFEARRERIRRGVLRLAEQEQGVAIMDEGLLDEVTALVEWPVPLVGSFDPGFLEVPEEALISSMQGHQKYFPVRGQDGQLLPLFITVANIESRDPDQVRSGNERVIRPRLADADFFWQQDRKRPLIDRLADLKGVIFQKQLGTLYDKTQRVAHLAEQLAVEMDHDPAPVARAAWLARCDLGTEMVGEFPELQGIMGRYYALHDGEPKAVADAILEHYRPRYAGEAIPATPAGRLLAIAERADTLAGIFAIGLAPTGDKDPFALRRAALGLMRTLIEGELPLDLEGLLGRAAVLLPEGIAGRSIAEEVYDFCLERLRGYYQEQGIGAELFEAVLAVRPRCPLDFHRRLLACRRFAGLPEAEALAAANKRIGNILRKAGETVPDTVASAQLKEPAEQALARSLEATREQLQPRLAEGDYAGALEGLARLREPVDTFFDDILVMAEDPGVRVNRLALLKAIQALFLEIADVSRLPGR